MVTRKPICPKCGGDLDLYGDYGGDVAAHCTEEDCDYSWDSVEDRWSTPEVVKGEVVENAVNPLIPAIYNDVIKRQLEQEPILGRLIRERNV